jgi:hypothetical protein
MRDSSASWVEGAEANRTEGPVMATQLSDDDQLKAAADAAQVKFTSDASYSDWLPKLAAHISTVQKVSREQFVAPAFQQILWESEAVSATGMGTVDVSKVIKSEAIARSGGIRGNLGRTDRPSFETSAFLDRLYLNETDFIHPEQAAGFQAHSVTRP